MEFFTASLSVSPVKPSSAAFFPRTVVIFSIVGDDARINALLYATSVLAEVSSRSF